MRNSPRLVLILLLGIGLTAGLLLPLQAKSFSPIAAETTQEVIPTVTHLRSTEIAITFDPTFEASRNATDVAKAIAYGTKVGAYAIEEAQIVYLLAADEQPENKIIQPEFFETEIGAAIAHTWADVLAYNEQVPIQALIIHRSALPEVDQDWTAAAYENGTIIIGINISHWTMRELIGTDRMKNPSFDGQIPGDSFKMYAVTGGFNQSGLRNADEFWYLKENIKVTLVED